MDKMIKKTFGSTHVIVLALGEFFTTKKQYKYNALSVILRRVYSIYRAEWDDVHKNTVFVEPEEPVALKVLF